ncbi:MAG TPA: hypothetical protein VHX65_00695 [Pirellulales bacterium]|nr:hypothetical protein [Pirellulales bacterium]
MMASNLLQSVTEEDIGREMIRMVPQWYEAACGPEEHAIPVGRHAASFCHHTSLTSNLAVYLDKVSARSRELQIERFVEYPGIIDILMESFAVEWLRLHSADTDWVRLINYLDTVARRTHENLPVALTLVIRPGSGQGDVTLPRLQRFFDRLAASAHTFTYLAVDADLRLIDYGSVEWSQVNDAKSYNFYPEFLHPIRCAMNDDDLVAHVTSRGELVIMNKTGLLATKRKRKWKIYDARDFEFSLAQCIGSANVAANLLELIFDLSFRRQGALLVYDAAHCVLPRVLNSESIVSPDWYHNGQTASVRESGQALIRHSIDDIAVGGPPGSLKKKRQLIEMASIDGAIIFDDDHILAIGALIKSHSEVGSQLGARATAARSSFLWGARPIKVSSDGDVTIYFKSTGNDQECPAAMNFL